MSSMMQLIVSLLLLQEAECSDGRIQCQSRSAGCSYLLYAGKIPASTSLLQGGWLTAATEHCKCLLTEVVSMVDGRRLCVYVININCASSMGELLFSYSSPLIIECAWSTCHRRQHITTWFAFCRQHVVFTDESYGRACIFLLQPTRNALP